MHALKKKLFILNSIFIECPACLLTKSWVLIFRQSFQLSWVLKVHSLFTMHDGVERAVAIWCDKHQVRECTGCYLRIDCNILAAPKRHECYLEMKFRKLYCSRILQKVHGQAELRAKMILVQKFLKSICSFLLMCIFLNFLKNIHRHDFQFFASKHSIFQFIHVINFFSLCTWEEKKKTNKHRQEELTSSGLFSKAKIHELSTGLPKRRQESNHLICRSWDLYSQEARMRSQGWNCITGPPVWNEGMLLAL